MGTETADPRCPCGHAWSEHAIQAGGFCGRCKCASYHGPDQGLVAMYREVEADVAARNPTACATHPEDRAAATAWPEYGRTIPDIIADWGQLAQQHAVGVLSPALVLAIIWVESHGHPWAYNPEPPYQWLYDVRGRRAFRRLTAAERTSEFPPADFPAPPGVDPDAEFWGQQASWGLMQVMGAVGRERGYMGTYLSGLSNPRMSVEYGTAHLRWLDQHFAKGDPWAMVGMYNGGPGNPNADYIGKVRSALDAVRMAIPAV